MFHGRTFFLQSLRPIKLVRLVSSARRCRHTEAHTRARPRLPRETGAVTPAWHPLCHNSDVYGSAHMGLFRAGTPSLFFFLLLLELIMPCDYTLFLCPFFFMRSGISHVFQTRNPNDLCQFGHSRTRLRGYPLAAGNSDAS